MLRDNGLGVTTILMSFLGVGWKMSTNTFLSVCKLSSFNFRKIEYYKKQYKNVKQRNGLEYWEMFTLLEQKLYRIDANKITSTNCSIRYWNNKSERSQCLCECTSLHQNFSFSRRLHSFYVPSIWSFPTISWSWWYPHNLCSLISHYTIYNILFQWGKFTWFL